MNTVIRILFRFKKVIKRTPKRENIKEWLTVRKGLA